MSRQSKNAKKIAARKQWSQLRKNGGHGPARTEPKHGKRNTELAKRKADMKQKLADAAKQVNSNEKYKPKKVA